MDTSLRIQISGRPLSGKTTLALLLQKFLEGNNFEVELIPDEWETVEHLIDVETTLGERVAGMRGKRVFITMVQAKKSGAIPEGV